MAYDLSETLQTIDGVLGHLRAAESLLRSAKAWSWADMLGGALFTTLWKREKMADAQGELRLAEDGLRRLSDDLRDASQLEGRLDTGEFLTFADYVLDNSFVDLFVHQHIKETLRAVDDVIEGCEKLKASLEGVCDSPDARTEI